MQVRTAAELLATPTRATNRPYYGIVVDAVDEAQDPEQLVSDLLEPLAAGARAWRIRLLLGLRTGPDNSLLRGLGPHALELRMDDSAYFEPADLVEYGRRCLLAVDEPGVSSPYRANPGLAERVAAAVARRAGTNFLVAQLTCMTLAALPEAVDDSPEQFPDSVGAAMGRYLAAFGDQRRRVRDLLTPLAFARGAGLSDPMLWAALATALGTDQYSAQDIAWLLSERRAVQLLESSGGNAHRLFHEALREQLRATITANTDSSTVHHLIVRTLIDHVPPRRDRRGPDWLAAGEYIRQHLAAHASAAHEITALLNDPLFLIATDPDQVIGYLPINYRSEGKPTPQIQAVIDMFHQAGRMLFVHDDAERAAYLQMAARKLHANDLANELDALPLPAHWSTPWARWQSITDGAALIGTQTQPIRGVTVGADLIISYSDSSTGVWAITNDEIEPVRLNDRPSAVHSAAPVAGGFVIVHPDGSMLRYDLSSGAAQPWTPDVEIEYPSSCTSMAYQGRELLVLAGSGKAQLWDPHLAQSAGPLLRLPAGSRLLATAVAAKRPLLLTESLGIVQTYDLLAGAPYGKPFPAFDDGLIDPDGPVWSGALGDVDGRAIAVIAGRVDRPIVRRDAITGSRIGDDLQSPNMGTTALTVGAGLLAAAGGDGRLRLFTWPGGRQQGPDIAAHEGGVDAVAVLQLSGYPAVATGGRDGATRIWFPDASSTRTSNGFGVGQLLDVTLGGEGRLLASTGYDLLLLDPADNGRTIRSRPAPCEDLTPMARFPGPGTSDLAVAMADGSVHLLDAATLKSQHRFEACSPGQIAGLTAAPGRILVATRTGQLQIWDPYKGRQICPPREIGLNARGIAAIDGIAFIPCGEQIESLDPSTGQPSAIQLTQGCSSGTSIRRINIGTLAGRSVAIGLGAGAHVHIWDAADGALLIDTTLNDGHGQRLSDVVTADLHGRPVVIAGSYNGAVIVWDLRGRVGDVIEIGPPVWSIATVDGDTIIAGGPSGLIAIKVPPQLVRTEHPRRDLNIR